MVCQYAGTCTLKISLKSSDTKNKDFYWHGEHLPSMELFHCTKVEKSYLD